MSEIGAGEGIIEKAKDNLHLSPEEKNLVSDYALTILSLAYVSLDDPNYDKEKPQLKEWIKIADEKIPNAVPLVEKVFAEIKRIEDAKSSKG